MFSSFISFRYLFSKKSHNAINIVSGVSAAAVGVVTAAMVCVLSVMNGFGSVVRSMFSEFDPELLIVAREGTSFRADAPALEQLREREEVAVFCEMVEQTALIEHDGRQLPAQLKGVDTLYQSLTQIDSIILDGEYEVWDGGFDRCVMGVGLAGQLGIGAHFVRGLHLYAPKRKGSINLMRPDESFLEESCWIAGIFAVNQTQYDEHLMLVNIDLARRLFEYDDHEVTSVGIKLASGTNLKSAKREIRRLLGEDYVVLDRYEQQKDFFRILKIEKLMSALLMVFILLIAAFNLIGSLTMLILDKQQNTHILRTLGANADQIHKIFLYEGWLVSSLGAVIGLVVGLILCLLQQHFGWLKLGSGTEYVLSAYPVEVQLWDVVLVLAVVLIIGWIAAYIPTKHLKTEQV